jgi:hypothetical protein
MVTPGNHNSSELLSQEHLLDTEAAKMPGMKPGTLRKWRLLGVGPRYRKFCRVVRYSELDLKAWLESRPAGSWTPLNLIRMGRTLPKSQSGTLAVVGGSQEISWTFAARIEPGMYRASCRSAKVYYDRQFKRWVCAVQSNILDSSGAMFLAQLTWYLKLGS